MIKKFKIFELNTPEDPYGEEEWEAPIGYFYVYKHRSSIDQRYAEEYYREEKPRIYGSYEEARRALNRCCFDDCDEAVFALLADGKIKRERFRR